MCRLREHCQELFWKHSGTEWVTLHYRTVAEGQWAEKKRKSRHVSFSDTHHKIADRKALLSLSLEQAQRCAANACFTIFEQKRG